LHFETYIHFSRRTSLDLPDPLFRQVKSRAVQEGMKLKDLIARNIEVGLRSSAPAETGARGQREPLPAAILPEAGKSPGKALTNREIQSWLDEDELQIYQRSHLPTTRDNA
jgi:hypothetical protein